ncbi:MAG TPA: hypothetical protein PLX08_10760 [Bacteroidales bacterium]|jgi:hypothetical protein|nr:hypothetical protein [Bacteroidales bacterium]
MKYSKIFVKTGRKLIPAGLILFLTVPRLAIAQTPSRLSAADLDKQLRKALIQNEKDRALAIISGNRLLIKPFVDGLVREAITLVLKGKKPESEQIKMTGEKAASFFEEVFGEKSLATGVKYLTIWTKEEKKKKLTADSLYSPGTELRIKVRGEFIFVCRFSAPLVPHYWN